MQIKTIDSFEEQNRYMIRMLHQF